MRNKDVKIDQSQDNISGMVIIATSKDAKSSKDNIMIAKSDIQSSYENFESSGKLIDEVDEIADPTFGSPNKS